MSAVNKVRFQQFLRQARAAKITEIHVNRTDHRNGVTLKYNGRAPRGRQRVTAEWTINRGERDDAAVEEEVKTFLAMARKQFFVHRGDGLKGEAFADAKMEAKGTPIVAGSDDTTEEAAASS